MELAEQAAAYAGLPAIAAKLCIALVVTICFLYGSYLFMCKYMDCGPVPTKQERLRREAVIRAKLQRRERRREALRSLMGRASAQ
jgi:hypothetical protein